MRMWMVDPKLMCRQHLLGEHVEIHMFVGHMERGRSIDGYLENNCLEMSSMRKRHDELVVEMKRRGYNHKSPLPKIPLHLYDDVQYRVKIDRDRSLHDLTSRCKECQQRSRTRGIG
jgi:hypothetical protein